jgi:DnaJ like chaperone protein
VFENGRDHERIMSIWGKVLGGAAGFALGGPLGALLGAILGHALDTRGEQQAADAGWRQAAFTVAVIALAAKMAKADGVVTRDEIAAFRERFHVPPHEVKEVGRLFDRARREANGFEPYARQIAALFRDEPRVLEELLDALFHIARADGDLSPEEIAFLDKVARIFGLSHIDFERLAAAHAGDRADAYAVLGVARTASDAEIKAAHRRLVQENHPDRLTAQGMPKEFVDIATEKTARINAAFDHIRCERERARVPASRR